MEYLSTRNKRARVSGAQAIVRGISAGDGGLFVPADFPTVSKDELLALAEQSYARRAAYLIGKFLPEIADVLPKATEAAYEKFEDEDPAPLIKVDDGLYLLELWHGPTHAFKDVALTLLPHLMAASKQAVGESARTLILVATSGDTGKAALEGFKDADGIDIAVLYPSGGVSQLQQLQMITTTGDNVYVCAVKGNFDDAQTAVKRLFTDSETAERLLQTGVKLSSANSINWGRLVPQIVYYFSAYCDLLSGNQIAYGDKINVCVPTGNFGNILAAWYAARMGLPIGKLLCASNRNNVLTDFLHSGTYNSKREFYKTISPSMDILISSNLERLIFELSGRDDKLTASRMESLKQTGSYVLTDGELQALQAQFWGAYADDAAAAEAIERYFDEYGYLADPHTAVALDVYDRYTAETGDRTPTVVVSTASPYKFVGDVLDALHEARGKDELACMRKLEEVTALPVPESLIKLPQMAKLYTDCVERSEVDATILAFAARRAAAR